MEELTYITYTITAISQNNDKDNYEKEKYKFMYFTVFCITSYNILKKLKNVLSASSILKSQNKFQSAIIQNTTEYIK